MGWLPLTLHYVTPHRVTLLGSPRALFGKAFQPSAALKALVYFEGGDLASLPGADRNTLIGAASVVGPLPVVKLRSKSLAIPIGARTLPA